jgi:hypothetical protein
MLRNARSAVAVIASAVIIAGCSSSPTTAGPPVTETRTAAVSAGPLGEQVTPESCGPLQNGLDGDFGNGVCKDGKPNAQAVDLFRQDGALTIDLDPNATSNQVAAAICYDNTKVGLTNPLRTTLYQVATALNRWRFAQAILDETGGIKC